MLEQCWNHSKQCRNNVVTLCCANNRRCESSRVTSPVVVVDDSLLEFPRFFHLPMCSKFRIIEHFGCLLCCFSFFPQSVCRWSSFWCIHPMVVCSYVTTCYFPSLRSLCAFLNSGKCGTVYLGIRKDGVVCGVNVGRKEVHLVNIYDKNIFRP